MMANGCDTQCDLSKFDHAVKGFFEISINVPIENQTYKKRTLENGNVFGNHANKKQTLETDETENETKREENNRTVENKTNMDQKRENQEMVENKTNMDQKRENREMVENKMNMDQKWENRETVGIKTKKDQKWENHETVENKTNINQKQENQERVENKTNMEQKREHDETTNMVNEERSFKNGENSRITIIYANDDDATMFYSRNDGSHPIKDVIIKGPEMFGDGQASVQKNNINGKISNETITSTQAITFKRKLIVLVATFTAVLLSTSLPFNLTIFYVEWLEEFGKSNSETSLVQSVCIGVFLIGGSVTGIAVIKYGPVKCGIMGAFLSVLGLGLSFLAESILHLILSVGVVAGFGFSLSFLSASSTVGLYFEGKQRLLVLAFVTMAGGVGGSVLPILCETLINKYAWRGALLVIAGATMHLFVVAMLLTKPKDPQRIDFNKTPSICKNCSTEVELSTLSSNTTNEQKRVSFASSEVRQLYDAENDFEEKSASRILVIVLKDKVFVLFIFAVGLSIASFNSVLIFFIDYIQSKGLSRQDAVSIITYMNIFNTVFRIVPGLAKQLPHVSILAIPAIATGAGCIALVLFPLAGSSFTENLAVTMVFGTGLGGIISVLTVAIIKLVGDKHYAVALGVSMTVTGVLNTTYGPVAGLIRDQTGSYDMVIYSSSACMLLGSILFSIVMVTRYCTRKDQPSRFDFELVIRRKSRRRSSIFPWRRKSVDVTSL